MYYICVFGRAPKDACRKSVIFIAHGCVARVVLSAAYVHRERSIFLRKKNNINKKTDFFCSGFHARACTSLGDTQTTPPRGRVRAFKVFFS